MKFAISLQKHSSFLNCRCVLPSNYGAREVSLSSACCSVMVSTCGHPFSRAEKKKKGKQIWEHTASSSYASTVTYFFTHPQLCNVGSFVRPLDKPTTAPGFAFCKAQDPWIFSAWSPREERKTSCGKMRHGAILKTRYLNLFQALIWQGIYTHASFQEQLHWFHLHAWDYTQD